MYAELIDRKIGQVYQKGVATKILQGMDRIRNEFDVTQARRWPRGFCKMPGILVSPVSPSGCASN